MPIARDPSAYRPQPKRGGADYWPTIDTDLQQILVQHVLPFLPPDSAIWEAAAGNGILVDVIRGAGYDHVIASDLLPRRHDIGSHDLLLGPPLKETRGSVLVTNPPNTRIDAFMATGLDLIDRGWLAGMALLLRLDHEMAISRSCAFNRACAEWLFSGRPWWIEGKRQSQPRFTNFWVLWLAGRSGPPTRRCLTHSDLTQPDFFDRLLEPKSSWHRHSASSGTR